MLKEAERMQPGDKFISAFQREMSSYEATAGQGK
jgi:hypothetical protein